MMFSGLYFSAPDWWIPAAILGFAAFCILLFAYRGAPVERRTRAACIFLKFLGISALALCLLEPLWSGQKARPGANFLLLVADNSQGMQISDADETSSRGEKLRDLLSSPQSTWQQKFEETFQVRRYSFDSRLQPVKHFADLNFDGRASAIGSSLRTIAERYRGQPLAGVLLFTDGNATDLPDGLPDWEGLPPIYPVMIGREKALRDLALENVHVSQTAFEDAPVTVIATVKAAGFSGQTISAKIFESTESATPQHASGARVESDASALEANAISPKEMLVQEQKQKVPRNADSVSFRFQFRPNRSGISFYRVAVAHELQDGPSGRWTEATLANNSQLFVVDRGRGPYRVLYVGGRPAWEFKFLNRALEGDDEIELVSLLRVANREPKFEFKGRTGESSNPLYRGFDKSDEATERYDQPVLRRLNTRDETELRDGFPKTAEELFAYHAIVLGDIEAGFFTHDQMQLLHRFVSERGGAFLMLGGQHSFQRGDYERTLVADLLPVYLDRIEDPPSAAGYSLDLTREGWLEPWARLRPNRSEEERRLDAMPEFLVLNRVRNAKPGASVIYRAADTAGREYPALVVQRYGHGRSAALLVGDMWRWGFRSEALQEDLTKSWRQFFRFLVSDVPTLLDLHAAPIPGDPNSSVRLQVRARDRQFLPLDNASVRISIQPMGKPASGGTSEPILLQTEPALTEPGLYEATYIPRETRGYLAQAVGLDSNAIEVGRAESGWTADPAAEEFRSLKPNRALLEAIARNTGGELVENLERLARQLPHRDVPITEAWSFPIWHTPLMFLFALGCFVAEWGLRRWKGLA
jgi:uncharacterized membrane protein